MIFTIYKMSIEIINNPQDLTGTLIYKTEIMSLYRESNLSFICTFICAFKDDLCYIRILDNQENLNEKYSKEQFRIVINNIVLACTQVNNILDKNIPLDIIISAEYTTLPFIANEIMIYFTEKAIYMKNIFDNFLDDTLYSLAQILYICFYIAISRHNTLKILFKITH